LNLVNFADDMAGLAKGKGSNTIADWLALGDDADD
jgi:hypothetical protein